MKNQKTDFQQSTLFPENRNYIKSIPSLIKWTGSKRSQASEILKLIPNHTRYFEPFLGGGAMLYALAQPNSVANDIFKPLVDLWKIIQCNPMQVIKDYKEKWGKCVGRGRARTILIYDVDDPFRANCAVNGILVLYDAQNAGRWQRRGF